MSLETGWLLAGSWYRDKVKPDWQRKPPAEAEAVFRRLGLTGDFWRLH